MKKSFLLILFAAGFLHGQIIVSPYVVYSDQQNRFASMIVQNETAKSYEVTMNFLFGYPVSDSLGNMKMKYIKSPAPNMPSLLNSVNAFPRRFTLMPGQKQVVRMVVRPPQNLKPGTYWVRIVTSTTQQIPLTNIDSSKSGISAKINYVLNQITTLIYRTGNITTGAEITKDIYNKKDGKLNFLTSLTRKGNSPFFGNVRVSLYDKADSLVASKILNVKVYYNLVVKNSFNLDKLKPGNYTAKIDAIFDEKQDIPQSKLPVIPPAEKVLKFKL